MAKTVEELTERFIRKWLNKQTVRVSRNVLDSLGRGHISTETTSEVQPKAERDLNALLAAVAEHALNEFREALEARSRPGKTTVPKEDTGPVDCWVIEPGQNGYDSTVVFLDGDINKRHHEALGWAKEALERLWDNAADPEEPQEFTVTMSRTKMAPCDVDWGD